MSSSGLLSRMMHCKRYVSLFILFTFLNLILPIGVVVQRRHCKSRDSFLCAVSWKLVCHVPLFLIEDYFTNTVCVNYLIFWKVFKVNPFPLHSFNPLNCIKQNQAKMLGMSARSCCRRGTPVILLELSSCLQGKVTNTCHTRVNP